MYIHYNENPRENYNAEDCVVRAIMCVTGKTWNEIYAALCCEGMYIGDWGNNNASWDWYVRSLGFKRYICPNECPFCYSVEDFAREHPTGKYIVATGTHAVAVIDGDYHDAREDFIYEVEELMNRAPDEHTRMKFERMLNDMR